MRVDPRAAQPQPTTPSATPTDGGQWRGEGDSSRSPYWRSALVAALVMAALEIIVALCVAMTYAAMSGQIDLLAVFA